MINHKQGIYLNGNTCRKMAEVAGWRLRIQGQKQSGVMWMVILCWFLRLD